MRASLVALLFALPAFAQEVDHQEEEWDPERPIEAQRETEEARTTSRLSFSASFGIISDPGSGGATGPRIGPSIAISKPLWMGTRRPFNQFLLEARVGAGWVPGKFALLQMSPMWGSNFYFGKYIGMETRVGMGFGAQLSSQSHFGIATQGEVGMVLRVFSDDRTRLKLLAGVGIQFFFDLPVGGLSAYLGAGFETAW